jgi:hypothetical protein
MTRPTSAWGPPVQPSWTHQSADGPWTQSTSSARSGPPTSVAHAIYAQNDGEARFRLRASGAMEFGDGTDTPDTNLYRDAADTLKTDDKLRGGR